MVDLGMGMIMMKQMLLKNVDNKHADWHDIVQYSFFSPFLCMSTPNKVSMRLCHIFIEHNWFELDR